MPCGWRLGRRVSQTKLRRARMYHDPTVRVWRCSCDDPIPPCLTHHVPRWACISPGLGLFHKGKSFGKVWYSLKKFSGPLYNRIDPSALHVVLMSLARSIWRLLATSPHVLSATTLGPFHAGSARIFWTLVSHKKDLRSVRVDVPLTLHV